MLLRQTLLYLPAQVLGPLFQFIAAIVWTHYLSPSEMGVFALIVASQELFQVVVLFWFSLYTIRYYDAFGEAAEKESFLNTESGVLLAGSACALIGVVPLAFIVDAAWTPGLIGATVLYAITRGIVAQLSDRARVAHQTSIYSVLQICWPVLGLLGGLVLIPLFGATAASILSGYAIAQAVSMLYALARMGFGKSPLAGSMQAIRVALRFGTPLVVGSMLIWLANNGIRFIVEHYEGAAAVGLLTVGWGLGLRGAVFASMLTTAAAFPVAMKRSRDEGLAAGQAQLQRNGVLLLAALAPASAGLWAIAEPMVKLLVAEPFHASTIAILPLAIVAGAVRSFRIHFGEQIFLLHERPMVPLWNDLFDAAAALAGSFIGLWYWGLAGAAAGAAAGAFASLLVTLFVAHSVYGFAIQAGDLGRIFSATAVMALTVRYLAIAPSALGLAGGIMAGAVLYGAIMLAFYPEVSRKAVRIGRELFSRSGTNIE